MADISVIKLPNNSSYNLKDANAIHKVESATNGHFAALDSNGNLTDSGHGHSDYATAENLKTIILRFESKSGFPQTGDANTLYIANDETQAYVWDGIDYHSIKAGKPYPVVTPPVPITGQRENGTNLPLITAGSTTGGTLQYSLDGINYSTSIPTAIVAGDYTVYYQVEGNADYDTVHAKTVTATIDPIPAYGVIWDGSSTTAWTRTDLAANFADPVPYVNGATSYGSPFDTIQPWAGMEIVEDQEAGKLVSIPKFYYKLEQSGIGLSIKISMLPLDGYHCSPMHMDRGDGSGERDIAYIGRYHSVISGSDAYKSLSGQTDIHTGSYSSSIVIGTLRNGIHNLGSKIWQNDFASRFTIWLLYLVEYANWNSQLKIGYGCSPSNNIFATGYTDSMPYHTGTTANARTTYGGTQYRYIEGLWDNVYDYLDGANLVSSKLYLTLNPTRFGNSNYQQLASATLANGFPKTLTVTNSVFPLFMSTASTGSYNASTYVCDYWQRVNFKYVVNGGCCDGGTIYSGLFYFAGDSGYGDTENGCRLMKLP